MSVNSLKIFAGHIITMSEMHKSAKLQLLNYVEEADEYQVKALLLDGEIMREPRDIVCEEIVDQRYYSSDLPGKLKDFEKYWAQMLS